MRFNDAESEILNMRDSLALGQVFKNAADYEQRSMANLLEVLIDDFCYRKGFVRVTPGKKPTQLAQNRTRANRRAHVGALA